MKPVYKKVNTPSCIEIPALISYAHSRNSIQASFRGRTPALFSPAQLKAMNKKLLLLLLVLAPAITNAQLGGLLNKVKNKATQKASQRLDNHIDKAIDEGLDTVEGKGVDKKEKTETAAVTGNEKEQTEPGLSAYSKYDFIAGKEIVYDENFDRELTGELPTGWNTNGSGEVVTLDKIPGKWLRIHKNFIYLSANEKNFSENFTAEFDVVMQLKNNGWMFPAFSVGVLATAAESTTGNNFLKEYNKYASVEVKMQPGTYNSSNLLVESFTDAKPYFKSEPKQYAALENYFGRPVHVAIQVQKQRFRIWINETKAFDVPKAIEAGKLMNQLFFKIGSTNYAEEQYGFYVSNIKVARGVEDSRNQLLKTGHFSTTAILFDVNTATLKPQSTGILKELAGVLKDQPGLRIKITGHTDSDGASAANLDLSQKRAAAVKDALVHDFDVDATRIETDGKGEQEPVADNATKEGRAANRRVEFVKL